MAAAWAIEFDKAHANEGLNKVLRQIIISGYDSELFRFRLHSITSTLLNKAEALELINSPDAETNYLNVFQSEAHQLETLLHYYAEERIVQAWVSDIGDLVNKLLPKSQRGTNKGYGYPHTAIEFDEPCTFEDKTWVLLNLPSDIWMPQIIDFRQIDGENFAAKDNQTLFLRNSSKLNQFLKEVFQVTQSLGGTIRVEEDIMHSWYLPMVSDNGLQSIR